MNKQIAEKILKRFKTETDLFNWCDEYKQYVSNGVSCCVTMEWDYMLKKSYEDNESPVSYEDLDLFDSDLFIERLEYEYNNADDEIKKELIENINNEIKTFEELKKYLENKDNDDLKEILNDIDRLIDIDLSECEAEIYEWWVLGDDLKYWLGQENEIFLNDAWGRCTTGQSISLDYSVRHSFLNMLSQRYNLTLD